MKNIITQVINRLTLKTYSDEYLNWLRFANAGMLHPGNIYAMKYAIDHLPGDEPVIEIGSFSGLSANVISYFLRKYHRTNKIFCSDKWIFEGSERGVYLGDSDILHSDYRTYVMENFKRNIDMFSPNRDVF